MWDREQNLGPLLPQSLPGVALTIKIVSSDQASRRARSCTASAWVSSLILTAARWGLIQSIGRLRHWPKVRQSKWQREICTLVVWLPFPWFLGSPCGTHRQHVSPLAPLVAQSAFTKRLYWA